MSSALEAGSRAAGERPGSATPTATQLARLPIRRVAFLRYTPADGNREEVRPVVEIPDNSSSCFAAMELQPSQSIAYLAAVKEPPVHPADHPFASFVEAGTGDRIRLLATRIEGSDAACQIRAQFRNLRGGALGPESNLTPESGKVIFADAGG